MKKIKMALYGEPGVGKSVFALGFEKPFFITTDGNYDWLEDFGADPDAHVRINSGSEFKEAIEANYDKYETIVVDLLEDCFKFTESDFCTRNKLMHVSDLGYGKGYDMSRNEFFMEICKLLNADKNVILLLHGMDVVTKDRRGVEHTLHRPTQRIPDKLLDMIEGRLRYFLRAYLKGEEQEDGSVVKKRYLSLVPKENEYGIIRGVDENKIPQDIELDANVFLDIINDKQFSSAGTTAAKKKSTKKVKTEEKVVEPVTQVVEEKPIEKPEEKVVQETVSTKLSLEEKLAALKAKKENKTVVEKPVDITEVIDEPVVTVQEEVKVEVKEEVKEQSNEDKMAAIKAKLAALKGIK